MIAWFSALKAAIMAKTAYRRDFGGKQRAKAQNVA
jgi:hypothetical protein